MRTDVNRKQNRRAGFSMIEVLVASTILVVIVMMLAMLFQQTSVAWRTGQIRARGAMRLRSYIGAIQRDAANAIDGKTIPIDLRCSVNSGKQKFTADEIGFYTLTGEGQKRALNYIKYTKDGTRTKYTLPCSTGAGAATWDVGTPSPVLDFLTGVSSDEKNAVAPKGFAFKWSDAVEYDIDGTLLSQQNRFPLYMTVDAQIVQKGKLYDVGAECSGPDGAFGDNPDKAPGKDDIRTWAK